MSNPIPPNVALGTIGELFVQMKLLELGWQTAPPLKDSGNDLIAIRGDDVLCLQVKTTKTGYRRKPKLINSKGEMCKWDAYVYVRFNNESPIRYDNAEVKIYSRPHDDIPKDWHKTDLKQITDSVLGEVVRDKGYRLSKDKVKKMKAADRKKHG